MQKTLENPWENIALLKSIIDSSTNHLCIVKPIYDAQNEIIDFEFILCNPSYCKYEKTSLEGCRLSATHEAKRHSELFNMLKRVQQSGEKEEFDFLDPSTNCWFHIRLINTGNNVLIAKEDITPRKKVEEVLKEQAHFISSVTDTMPDIVSVMQWPSKKLVYTNRTPFSDFEFDFILKTSEEEREKYIHPDDREIIRQYYDSFATLPDEGLVKCDYRAINNKGEWVWFRVRGKVFKRKENGEPVQCVNIVQNINNLKVAEEELLNVKLRQQKEILNAIIYTQEQERERIGESLHNGVAQLLYGIQTRLQLLNATDADSEKNIREINSILKEAIVDTRNISFELVPTVLKDHGIEVALRALFQRIIKDKPHVDLQTQGLENRIPEKIEFAIYRIIQELINNIIKHSGASNASIYLVLKRKRLQLTVSDTGTGFDRKALKGVHKGIGLQSIENRVKLLGGAFKIKTGPSGTTVLIGIPVS